MSEIAFPYYQIDLWIEKYPKLKALGPFTTSSSEFARVLEFRREWNQLGAPYLNEPNQLKIEEELQIDERSLHFALEYEGQIIACVRATPRPFELSKLSYKLDKAGDLFQNYYEFSRLCTNTKVGRRALYASLLVIKAAAFIFSNRLAEGILGICRADRMAYMKHLGLQSDELVVHLEARNGNYQFIRASKEELLKFYLLKLNEVFSKTETPSAPRPPEVSP
jgi:hypothetical protein